MVVPKTVRAEAQKLRKEIKHHDYLYYSLDNPEIEDAEYDQLFQKLIALEKQYPGLQTADSPTQRVGGTRASYLPPAKHDVRMLSIRNAPSTTFSECKAFDEQIRKDLKLSDRDPPVVYLAELKIDGAGVSLRYVDGKLIRGATRGDGEIGEDITPNLKSVLDIRSELKTQDPPSLLEVRGEVYMLRSDFENLNKKLTSEGGTPFKNPRNAAAGSIRQLDSSITAQRKLSFFTHSFAEAKGWQVPKSQLEILEAFEQFGLKVNPRRVLSSGHADLERFYKEVQTVRGDLDFDIDGVVYKVNRRDFQDTLGSRDREPRWAIAHKFPPETKPTKVLGIDIQVGRTGALTPVARLEAVQLAGVTVTNATLHNLNEIEGKDVRVGDTVLVRRAGDVIPEIVSVELDKRPQNTVAFQMPSECPVCGSKVIQISKEQRLKTKVNVVKQVIYRCVGGLFCTAQKKRALLHFASRKAMNIDGFGEKVVDRLVEGHLVKTPADIYVLSKEQLTGSEGNREVSAQKLLAAISASKKTTLARLLYALGIPGIGEVTAKDLSKTLGGLDRIANAFPMTLTYVPGIGMELASSIHAFFHTDHNLDVIRLLKERGVSWEETNEVHLSMANLPTFASFIEGFEIPDVGDKAAIGIGKTFAGIGELAASSEDDISEQLRSTDLAPALARRAATALKNYFSSPENLKQAIDLSDQLREFGVHWEQRTSPKTLASLPLDGKIFVLTGRLPSMGKDEVEDQIESLGGRVTSSVSAKTHYVVVGADAGSKLDDAKRLEIPILNERQLLDLLAAASKQKH